MNLSSINLKYKPKYPGFLVNMKTIWSIWFPDITVVSEFASAGILEMQLLYLSYKVIFNINFSLVSKMKKYLHSYIE